MDVSEAEAEEVVANALWRPSIQRDLSRRLLLLLPRWRQTADDVGRN